MFSVQCSVCSVQCAVFSVNCALLVDKEAWAELSLYADDAEDNPVQSSAARLHCSTEKNIPNKAKILILQLQGLDFEL